MRCASLLMLCASSGEQDLACASGIVRECALILLSGGSREYRVAITAEATTNTIPPETNSNDFGCFWNQLADSNSNFVVAEIFFEGLDFLVCSKFNHTHHVALHLHVMCAWCRYTRGRFERTHGHVLNGHTGFSRCHTTHTHTPHHTTPHTTPSTHHNTRHNTTQQHDRNTTRR